MKIENVHSKSDVLIAQISDIHISTPDSVNDRFFRTLEHLNCAVAHLNGLARRPDLVVVTGDLVEHGQAEEYRRLRSSLDRLEMPFYIIPGNHDARSSMATAFADHSYLPKDGDFLHYTVEEWPVRLIGLDTLVPGHPGGLLCSRRLEWIDSRLAEAPARPTIVFMHHPPFLTGIAAVDAMGLEGRETFAVVIGRHPQVERVLCGHVHRPVTSRFAGTIASSCPSTAHQVALDLVPARRLAVVMERPACMLHLWLGDAAAFISHLSVIGDPSSPFTLYDGERWLKNAEPPREFQPH